MRPFNALISSCFGASMCLGCAVPQFDVPTDSAGQPTVQTIVDRIQCEMRDMVRDDSAEPTAFHRLFLLNGDYDVAIALKLEVNNTGGLAPSLSYIDPLTKATMFTFSGTATLSESRDHTFTENIQFSFREIYTKWKYNVRPYNCPSPDTNLAGTLGMKDFVAMAALTENLDTKQTLSGKGVFGGSIQFLVTKSLTSLGPTWSLVNFKGPGGVTASQINTDSLTLAFAQGPNVGKPMIIGRIVEPNPPNKNAYWFLQQQLNSSIISQLITLQTSLPNSLPSLPALLGLPLP
jgi:hypothetical protein